MVTGGHCQERGTDHAQKKKTDLEIANSERNVAWKVVVGPFRETSIEKRFKEKLSTHRTAHYEHHIL